MADNFNLRQFLSENKLTKNAKLLSEEEQQEGYQPKSKLEQIIQAAWAEKDLNKAKQMVVDLLEPSKVKSKDQIIQTLKGIQNKTRFDQYLANSLLKFEKLGLSEESEDIKEGSDWGITLDGRPVDIGSIEIDGMDPEDRPDYSDAYIAYAEFEDGTELTPQEIDRLQDENYGIIHDLILHRGLDEAAKPKEIVKESTFSPREKYLTRLVENALGLDTDDMEDNVSNDDAYAKAFETMGEGEEMVTEKPVPSYKSIEELMKEIDHGTNEAACKYKMEEMKRIAQALEEKVSSLEEGEHAEFRDTKKIKQMKKDILTLRKQADKLEKEYDKKFGEKKSKKEEN